MKKFIYMITAAVLSLCLASCSIGSGTADSGTDSAETEAEEKEITNDITAGITDVDTFDPLKTASPSVRDVCGFIFEPLFDIEQDLRTTPVLARSCAVSADGKTLTVKLQQGIKWHDGTSFSAKDVVYTVNILRRGTSWYSRLTEPISGVWAPDGETVAMTLGRAVPNAAALLVFPIVKNGSEGSSAVIGTGPFKYEGDRLTAYEEYHGGRAQLDTVHLREIPDEDKYVSLFNANVIDFATSDILDMASYMPKSNASVKEYVSNTMVFAGFNGRRAAFSDKSARDAVSKLIDRETAAAHIYYSRAVASGYAMNPASWLSPDGSTRLRADEKEAISVLEDAGWKTDSGGKYYTDRDNSTVYLSADIIVNQESAERVKIANALCERMNTIGMTAKVTECTSAQFEYRVTSGDYDMFIGETELLPNNDISALAESGRNGFGYSNPEVDTLLAQLSAAQNDWDLKALSDRLYTKLAEDAPFAPICFMKKSMAVGAKLKNGVYPSIQGLVRASKIWSVK